ncbi:probable disease resistance RPP8-like protein 4 [Pistacia vera]|uniref:probable disease resistance RPP8-like protein 4 n=1 Tax=Pistacia vera TaxID=55513 RepID=UPI0012636279|nr:probable disease resistance RPP8-like protein 4 [Pistacia vera]
MGGNEDHDEKFLENLQLPPNLMRLKIVQYSGKVMSSKWVTLLKKLRFLSLNHCMKLDNLPPLGKLSSLESLIIRSSRNVERVGNEFLGLEITDSKSLAEAFPKLEHLEFQDMKEWKEWNYGIVFAKEENVKIMERIESLTIAFCPKLKTLPDYIYKATTLKELKIISCPELEKIKDSIQTKLMDSSGCRPKFFDLKYIEKGSH